MTIDYYAVLGVARDAGSDEIRQRFRQLARERHPDRFRGAEKDRAETAFQEITEAFNVLFDPERRRQHDSELADPLPDEAAGRGHDPREVARVWLSRGVRAYREKRWREATEAFENATEAMPREARAWYYLGVAASRLEQRQELARAAIEQACTLEPMNVTHLRAAGRIVARAGDVEGAERWYQEALRWSADDAEIRAEMEEVLKGTRKPRFGLFGRS
jgi:curved DNA-binding protein CbpA